MSKMRTTPARMPPSAFETRLVSISAREKRRASCPETAGWISPSASYGSVPADVLPESLPVAITPTCGLLRPSVLLSSHRLSAAPSASRSEERLRPSPVAGTPRSPKHTARRELCDPFHARSACGPNPNVFHLCTCGNLGPHRSSVRCWHVNRVPKAAS